MKKLSLSQFVNSSHWPGFIEFDGEMVEIKSVEQNGVPNRYSLEFDEFPSRLDEYHGSNSVFVN